MDDILSTFKLAANSGQSTEICASHSFVRSSPIINIHQAWCTFF